LEADLPLSRQIDEALHNNLTLFII
jgi:hypothetical protein